MNKLSLDIVSIVLLLLSGCSLMRNATKMQQSLKKYV